MSLRFEIWTGVDRIKGCTTRGKAREFLYDLPVKHRGTVYMSVSENNVTLYTFASYDTALAWLKETGDVFQLIETRSKRQLYRATDIIPMYYEVGRLMPKDGELTVLEYKDGRMIEKWTKEHMRLARSAYGHLTHNPFPTVD